MSGSEEQLEANLPFSNDSRRSSQASSKSRKRKISRLESVVTGTGTVLIELDEELHSEGDDDIIIPRKDSLVPPTTMGGVPMETVAEENGRIPGFDKAMKRRLTHHNPNFQIEDIPDDSPEIDCKSQDSKSSSQFAQFLPEGIRRIFLTTTHHLHLAFAAPSIIRIPHLAHKYSSKNGSAFIFAYFLCLVIVAMPICILETTLAQFSSLGPVNMFGCCLPLVKGIGFGMIMTCSLLMLISSTTLSWSSFYLFHSFKGDLPWAECPTNMTPGCKNTAAFEYGVEPEYGIEPEDELAPMFIKISYIPSDYYFQKNVLESLDVGSEDPLQLNLTLAAILLGLWTIHLVLVYSRISWRPHILSSSFAVITLIMLIAVMINGLNLENSGRGLSEVFNVNFSTIDYQLAEPDLWLDCLGQAFWSLGPCIGLLITRASYNNFNKKILSEVSLSVLLNLTVQYLLMITIFPYAGHLYTSTVYENIGYFFIMSSYAVTEGLLPHTTSLLFFLCVCENLLTHTVMLAETVATALAESLPLSWRSGFRRFSVDFVVCAFGFVASLPFVTKEGIYYLTTTDTLLPWVAGVSLGLIEIFALTFLYGRQRIEDHYYKMQKSNTIFIWFCKFFLTLVLLGLLIWVAVCGIANEPISWDHSTNKREDSYFTYGLTLALLPLACASLSLLYQFGINIKNPEVLVHPSPDWATTMSCHTTLMNRKDRKKIDRRKPWLVVQSEELGPRENESVWIPLGYSWVPEGPAAKILKEGRSDINPITRRVLANYLKDRYSSNATKPIEAIAPTEISMIYPTPSTTTEEIKVSQRISDGNLDALREQNWSIERFLNPVVGFSPSTSEVSSKKNSATSREVGDVHFDLRF